MAGAPDSVHGIWRTPLGTWFASPDEIAGSWLESVLRHAPTARVLVLDIAGDKNQLMTQLSALIETERFFQGIAPGRRRGPKPKPGMDRTPDNPLEYAGFLRSIRCHHIVPLWDLQLAGLATTKLATAQAPYRPDITQKRSLLAKLRQARKLQDEVLNWVALLRASG